MDDEAKVKKLKTEIFFTVDDHNKMIKTIDDVILEIKKFNTDDNLELSNAIKNLLEGAGRINNYYKSINNPTQNNPDERKSVN